MERLSSTATQNVAVWQRVLSSVLPLRLASATSAVTGRQVPALWPPKRKGEQNERQRRRKGHRGTPDVEVGHLGPEGLSDPHVLNALHADALNVPEPGLTYVSEALLCREPEAVGEGDDWQQPQACNPWCMGGQEQAARSSEATAITLPTRPRRSRSASSMFTKASAASVRRRVRSARACSDSSGTGARSLSRPHFTDSPSASAVEPTSSLTCPPSTSRGVPPLKTCVAKTSEKGSSSAPSLASPAGGEPRPLARQA
eukprot:CAMPEP_0204570278 /NCGR_PEP_ID=MMETSP0661-20131031/38227_1 /ASSEMBLY_ACC=CAM_ASM_000606 /TAXON_ID=109239 /ORGANISM="Alexandrium margalefi, Strain AMGDE01CS-322" /LENGTH=256 /DNA_ID=CAMNT_0051578457 /DNA_START=128 /DNA_END=896 /DNA_ORIENTATION=+